MLLVCQLLFVLSLGNIRILLLMSFILNLMSFFMDLKICQNLIN